jgi:hypothetical protein
MQRDKKAVIDRLTIEIDEARTASFSLFVIADRSDYAPLRITGQQIALSGERVISTDDRKQAQEIADEMNAYFQANRIDRRVEVMETLAWRSRRVERLVEQLAAAQL